MGLTMQRKEFLLLGSESVLGSECIWEKVTNSLITFYLFFKLQIPGRNLRVWTRPFYYFWNFCITWLKSLLAFVARVSISSWHVFESLILPINQLIFELKLNPISGLSNSIKQCIPGYYRKFYFLQIFVLFFRKSVRIPSTSMPDSTEINRSVLKLM